ncbi:MAG: holo-ACP synthase [Clostridia bacterium]|nr:holo-ACP synthase [Clostridia bacterium]
MKITCGTDIIEIERIKKIINETENGFLNRVYSKNEIEYCESKQKVKYQHYAARFAAKEAIFKAISNNLKDKFEISWKDAEILNDENGRPEVKFINKKIEGLESIEISISHCKEYAVANVVAVWKD